MNKRGLILAKKTLNILLALICIIFLVIFLVSLYYSHVRDKDLELAEASLKHLINEINSGATEVEIWNPVGGPIGVIEKNWFILSWPYENVIPNSCSKVGWKSCLCICEGGFHKGEDKFAERCDEEGNCLENDFTVMGEKRNYIKIQNPPLTLTIEGKIITQKT